MNKYTVLLLLNLPIVILGILNVIVTYKLRKFSKKKMVFRLTLWLLVLIGLILAEPIYDYLYSNGLTNTDSMSLFDVVQITAIILVLFIATKAHSKINALEEKFNVLHRQLSIDRSDHYR